MEPDLRGLILEFARSRTEGKTFCPSEVARATGRSDWRALMPQVREVAFTLTDEGAVVVMQRGEIVDGRAAKGPLRLAAATPREADPRADMRDADPHADTREVD